MNVATVVVAVFATILGLVGLFMASRAADTGIYLFGLAIFAFSIVLDFQFIKRHFDGADAE